MSTKVSEEEFAALEARARARKLTLSEWVRAELLEAHDGAADEVLLGEVLAPSKNPCSGARTRSTLHGALDLGLGVAKMGLGTLAAPETGGLSLYGVYSGLSNVVSGGAELYGGYSGNLAGSERVANYAAATGSVSGLTTLAITGNAQYGANASAIEGLAFVGATGGLVSAGAIEAPGLANNTVTALDNGAGAAGLIGIGGCHD